MVVGIFTSLRLTMGQVISEESMPLLLQEGEDAAFLSSLPSCCHYYPPDSCLLAKAAKWLQAIPLSAQLVCWPSLLCCKVAKQQGMNFLKLMFCLFLHFSSVGFFGEQHLSILTAFTCLFSWTLLNIIFDYTHLEAIIFNLTLIEVFLHLWLLSAGLQK